MILAMTASTLISIGSNSTGGASDAAHFVSEQLASGRRHLQSSFSLGMAGKGVFDELCEVADACGNRNWDGYDAEAISDEAYRQAYRFIESLPLGTPAPSIGAEPDGHLTLEWYRSPRRTLSVSVSPDGDIHYAALLPGPEKHYGSVTFFGETPSTILQLIKRIHGT